MMLIPKNYRAVVKTIQSNAVWPYNSLNRTAASR